MTWQLLPYEVFYGDAGLGSNARLGAGAGWAACVSEGTMMGEERAQILEMLMAGRVTVEQADQLLQALDVPSSPAHQGATSKADTQRRGDERRQDFFVSLTAEQLVALRDSGVSRAYVEQMRSAGLSELRVEDLIELHDNGITPRFVRDLREVGLADL